DLTCIAVGLLIRSARVNPVVGLGGCFLGIFLGDLGLWLLGFLVGQGLLRLSLVGRVVPAHRRAELSRWLDERGAAALLAARFLPGVRLPLYVAAGLLGQSLRRFAFWTFLAALLWTPAVVFLAALLGEAVVRPAQLFLGSGWLGVLLG